MNKRYGGLRESKEGVVCGVCSFKYAVKSQVSTTRSKL
jgi:hypothetical protein